MGWLQVIANGIGMKSKKKQSTMFLQIGFPHKNDKYHKPNIHELLIKQPAYADQEEHGWLRPSLGLCFPLQRIVVAVGWDLLDGGLG